MALILTVDMNENLGDVNEKNEDIEHKDPNNSDIDPNVTGKNNDTIRPKQIKARKELFGPGHLREVLKTKTVVLKFCAEAFLQIKLVVKFVGLNCKLHQMS